MNKKIIISLSILLIIIIIAYNRQENAGSTSETTNFNAEAVANIASVYSESTSGTATFNNLRVTNNIDAANNISAKQIKSDSINSANINSESIQNTGQLNTNVATINTTITAQKFIPTKKNIQLFIEVGNYKGPILDENGKTFEANKYTVISTDNALLVTGVRDNVWYICNKAWGVWQPGTINIVQIGVNEYFDNYQTHPLFLAENDNKNVGRHPGWSYHNLPKYLNDNVSYRLTNPNKRDTFGANEYISIVPAQTP